MKLIPINSEASHMLRLTRKDAFEILQFLAQELADDSKAIVELAIFDDADDSSLPGTSES